MGGRGEARKKDRMDRVLLDIHSITAGGVVGVDRRRHRSRRGPGSAVCSSGPTAPRRTLSDGGRAEGRGGDRLMESCRRRFIDENDAVDDAGDPFFFPSCSFFPFPVVLLPLNG